MNYSNSSISVFLAFLIDVLLGWPSVAGVDVAWLFALAFVAAVLGIAVPFFDG